MAPASLRLIRTEPWSECLICKKPLGADSKDQDYMFCHEHRKCSDCSTDLSVTEAKLCVKKFIEDLDPEETKPIDYSNIEIICANCYRIKSDPTRSIKQSELDYLNMIRLMIEPDTNLSQGLNEKNAVIYNGRLLQTMNFEKKIVYQKRLEAILEHTQDTVRSDKDFRKNYLAEREKERFDKAQQEKQTSSRPTSKIATDPEELQLAHFIELRGLDPANRKENLKMLRDRNKEVPKLMKIFNFTEQQTIDYLESMRKFKIKPEDKKDDK